MAEDSTQVLDNKIFITCNPVDETGTIINDYTVDKDGNFIGNLAKNVGNVTNFSSLLKNVKNGEDPISKGVGFFVGLILIVVVYFIGKYVFKKMANKMEEKTKWRE